jgi:hypothetical protein
LKSKIVLVVVALSFSTAAFAAGEAMKCCCKDKMGHEMPAPTPAPTPSK